MSLLGSNQEKNFGAVRRAERQTGGYEVMSARVAEITMSRIDIRQLLANKGVFERKESEDFIRGVEQLAKKAINEPYEEAAASTEIMPMTEQPVSVTEVSSQEAIARARLEDIYKESQNN